MVSPIKSTILEAIAGFEAVLDCTITVHSYVPQLQRVVGEDRRIHNSRFCSIIRQKREQLKKRCRQFDQVTVQAHLLEHKKPFIKTCHAGVAELVLPIFHEERLAGLIFAGPFQTRIAAAIQQRPLTSLKMVESERERLPVRDQAFFEHAQGMLLLLVEHLETAMKTPAAPPRNRREQIGQFLDQSFRRPIKLADLANHLQRCESRTSQLLSELFGQPFTELVNRRRIEFAQSMLTTSYFNLERIGREAGFRDPGYFYRVFKKQVGTSPGEWRRAHRADSLSTCENV